MQNDTIAAIATPPGVGGVGIIRISGPDAFAIVQSIFKRPHGQQGLPPSHTLTFGHIIDPQTHEILDEVLVAFMSEPHTYTREPVVEIQGHGGPLVLRRILRAVLALGARMANPGEFTQRAFMNGRLDLAQAEAVMDLIASETEAGQRLAMQQLRGRLSAQIEQVRSTILGVIAKIEASIDFPEDDVPTPTAEELLPGINEALSAVDTLLAGADQGRLYRQGLRTAIIGRPNVGKSSLLNALLHMERAIVTPVAGTTRDTVEEVANLHGIPLHLIDTAGITPTDDPVERIGVQRSRDAAESADVILLVFDGSEPLTELDQKISDEVRTMGFGILAENEVASVHKRPVLLVLSKADQAQRVELRTLRKWWPTATFINASTVTETGLQDLERALSDIVSSSRSLHSESVLVTSARHQEALRQTHEHLHAAQGSLAQQLPLDFISIDLRAAYDACGEITGETASDDLLDKIFHEFCIGK